MSGCTARSTMPAGRSNHLVPKRRCRCSITSCIIGAAPVTPSTRGSRIRGTSAPDPLFVRIRIGDSTRSSNPSPLKSPQTGWKPCSAGFPWPDRANSGSRTFRMKLTRFVSCRSSACTVMAVEPAAPCGPRVICSTRFDTPTPDTIRKEELLTIRCRELHAWRLSFEPDSTSHAENGTVKRPCPFSAT